MRTVAVTLVLKTQSGTDDFGAPTYTETTKTVSDVLVGMPTSEEINNAVTMYGKRITYTLGIPKGDANVWEDTEVILPAPFSGRYRTIGYPTQGIPENVPTRWNTKVLLERIND